MTDLLYRFGAWVRSVILGGSATAPAMEEVLSVKEDAVGDQPEVVQPKPDEVPVIASQQSAMEMPRMTEEAGEDSIRGGDGRPPPAPVTITGPISSPLKGWEVRPIRISRFEKVGRAYVDSGDLIIRLDLNPRMFVIREHDLDKTLTDGEGKIRTPGNSRAVGTTRLSTSGRALNVIIDKQLYTIPMRSLMPVLAGKNRKAAVWRGRI